MSDTISRSRAIRRLLKLVRPREAVLVSPHEAVGLIASHNVCAYCDVPEQPCSLRDGYALRTADIEKSGPIKPVTLTVTHTVRAESIDSAPVEPGTTARVLTGGIVPDGADAVLAEEDVVIDGDTIQVRTPVRSGWFVRPAGGEIKQETIIVRAGEIITPQAAAVMIRTRVSSIHARPKPTARVISVGSELSDPCCGDECDTARFPADNLIVSKGLLEQSGMEITEIGVLPDNLDRLVSVLSSDNLPDLIITTGGTGRSERDFARTGAKQAGFTTIFNHVDLRPGRNMFAAHKDNTLLFCLPGPPGAVFACFHAIILTAIRRLRGLPDLETPIMARLENGISAKPGGQWLLFCSLAIEGATIVATPLINKDTPPMLAMAHADGIAILSGGDSVLPGGEVEIVSTRF